MIVTQGFDWRGFVQELSRSIAEVRAQGVELACYS